MAAEGDVAKDGIGRTVTKVRTGRNEGPASPRAYLTGDGPGYRCSSILPMPIAYLGAMIGRLYSSHYEVYY